MELMKLAHWMQVWKICGKFV